MTWLGLGCSNRGGSTRSRQEYPLSRFPKVNNSSLLSKVDLLDDMLVPGRKDGSLARFSRRFVGYLEGGGSPWYDKLGGLRPRRVLRVVDMSFL